MNVVSAQPKPVTCHLSPVTCFNMRFSYNILKSWIPFKLSAEELTSLIDLHITEVEALTELSQYPGVVVGEILKIEDHPNADKLHLTIVDIGKEKLRIVCGAKNIAVGQKVPVATIGTTLPNEMVIKQAAIRGEESFGMLCSESELGLAETSEGLLILDPKTEVGTTLDAALGTPPDYSIEIKVLSNRPDYMSYFSFARELAAVLKIPFTPPISLEYSEAKFKTKDYLKVEIKDKAASSRYIARVVRNLQVKPSPVWLKQALRASGLRSINNLVDITNYVMLESGHPVHMFDYNRLASTEIMVRFASSGEDLLCLDGVTRKLDPEMAVIADLKRPIAIAGVMGGEYSGVNEETVDIVVEVANFDRANIRRTARKLGLRTDASARFERGVDILDSENVMARILHLIKEDSPEADVFAGSLDVHDRLPAAHHELKVSVAAINHLIGLEIAGDVMVDILNRLNLNTELIGEELKISIPHYRQDILGMADIAEEVLRLYGSDKVPSVMSPYLPVPIVQPPLYVLSQFLKHQLANLGLTEVQTHAFTTKADDAVVLSNPLTENWTHLKTDLLPGLFALETGQSHSRIFEINNIFIAKKNDLPIEFKQLAVRVSGSNAYRQARGILDFLLERLNLEVKWEKLPRGNGMKALIGKYTVATTVIHDAHTAGFNFDLTMTVELVNYIARYQSSSKFPSIKMDMAFAIKPDIQVGEMMALIEKTDPLVTSVELFDDFQMPDDTRSVAFHIELRSATETLTSEIRDLAHTRIKTALAKTFKATLRE